MLLDEGGKQEQTAKSQTGGIRKRVVYSHNAIIVDSSQKYYKGNRFSRSNVRIVNIDNGHDLVRLSSTVINEPIFQYDFWEFLKVSEGKSTTLAIDVLQPQLGENANPKSNLILSLELIPFLMTKDQFN